MTDEQLKALESLIAFEQLWEDDTKWFILLPGLFKEQHPPQLIYDELVNIGYAKAQNIRELLSGVEINQQSKLLLDSALALMGNPENPRQYQTTDKGREFWKSIGRQTWWDTFVKQPVDRSVE